MQDNIFKITLSTSLLVLTALNHVQAEELELSITADFRPTTLEDSTVSVSLVPEKEIKKRGAGHIEEVLNAAPNVNMSSGGSRAKFFQIRGIGERSQFELPSNPSVGLLIDNMDFSRSGAAATLFDVEQVEVIRGPQGTKYGASSLAGLIKLTTAEPTNERTGKIETTIGNYGQKSLGIAVGGPLINNKLLGRFSIHQNNSDGTVTNEYLGRDDTNGRDELTLRGHLKWLANDDLTVRLRYLHQDLDNNYDAFNFANNRTTYSDEPGKDSQKANAFSVNTKWDANPAYKFETDVSYSETDLEYSYDEDWTYSGQYNGDGWVSTDNYDRNRKSKIIDTKLLSKRDGRIFNGKSDWVVGLYHANKTEDLKRVNSGISSSDIENQYSTKSTALYGQLDTKISPKTNLITGLRVESWSADYLDSNDLNVKTDEVLYGGKIGIEHELNTDHLAHASISRGYKAGGINTNGGLPQNALDYKTEYNWNFEVGINSSFFDEKLNTRLSAFYAKRKDQQVDSSLEILNSGGGTSFTGYFGNAAEGTNYGIEGTLDWKVNDKWTLKSTIGLLETNFDDYENPDNSGVDLTGRDHAHAPNYQYTLGAEYKVSDRIKAGLSLEGKDGFYFSEDPDALETSRSNSYNLVNVNLSYTNKNWTTTLWGRNLLDKDYDVRGFGSFGNNPSNGWTKETYTQKGEPRTVGVTVSYDF